jgi:hypothetical protein
MVLLQEITLKYAKVQLFDTKLIRVEIFGNRIIGRTEAREINDAVGVLSKGRESLVLIVANEVSQFTKEAVEFSVSDEGLRYNIGDALVVKSLTQRITANIYLKLNKPKKPSKIFNTEKEAVKWLHSLEEELVAAW